MVSSMKARNSHPPALGPSPWLVFCHGKRERTQTFFSVSDGSYKVKSIPEMRRTYCWASYYGWLVMIDETGYFLLDSVSLKKIQLPYSKLCRFSKCVLSAPPTDPDCLIILYGSSIKSFMYCRLGCDKWIERKYKLEESIGFIGQVVCCNGKLYAYSCPSFGIIDLDGDPVITWLVPEGPRTPPTAIISIISCLYLVESAGEIFLVKECHLTTPRIVKFKVYKMDFSRMVWEEVETLGDRVLFLGWCCSTSCSAADSGIERDCIYFTKENDTNLYTFHLNRGTISVDLPCPNVRPPWHCPLWVLPMVFQGSDALQIKQERTQNELEEIPQEITEQCEKEGIHEITTAEDTDVFAYRPWSDLPIGLLELIALYLFRVDGVHMTSTCRSWRLVDPPSRIIDRYLPLFTKHDLPLLRNNTPWLMFFQKEDGICNFLDPLYNETYFINTPELSGSTACYCKDGWVFMYKGNYSVFLFNPFIRVKVQLPDWRERIHFQSVSFGYTPTYPDFVIVCVVSSEHDCIIFEICYRGGTAWEEFFFSNNLPFLACYSNPVFYDEVFYVLGHNGRLGVFDPKRFTWTVLAKPEPLEICHCRSYPTCNYEQYLVESRGELLMVVVGFLGSPIDVYRLEEMEWARVESLEDRMLFVGFWASVSSTTIVKGMGNKIYFPMTSGKQCVFYSLKDRRCYPNPDFYKSEEYIYSTWVEPRWFRPSAEELNWSRDSV